MHGSAMETLFSSLASQIVMQPQAEQSGHMSHGMAAIRLLYGQLGDDFLSRTSPG